MPVKEVKHNGRTYHLGESHHNWRGDKLGYIRIHKWVNKEFGHPDICEICKNQYEARYMEWSNIDHNYRREREDWQRLCRKCHKEYDRQHFGITGGAGRKTLGRINRK